MRVKREITRIHHVSKEVQNTRVVNNFASEFWSIIPYVADILSNIPQLKVFKGQRLSELENQIKADMSYIQHRLKELLESLYASEVLKVTEAGIPYRNRHLECCLPLPFAPCTIAFPPGEILRIALLAFHNYVHLVLYEPLRKAGLRLESLEEEADTVESYAFEICRTFAAIEDADEGTGGLLLCFQSLSMAAFSCPSQLRLWLWHKLTHFEELARHYVEPFKKVLSVLWGMPEVLTMGFGSGKPMQGQNKTLSVDDVELAAKVVATNIED